MVFPKWRVEVPNCRYLSFHDVDNSLNKADCQFAVDGSAGHSHLVDLTSPARWSLGEGDHTPAWPFAESLPLPLEGTTLQCHVNDKVVPLRQSDDAASIPNAYDVLVFGKGRPPSGMTIRRKPATPIGRYRLDPYRNTARERRKQQRFCMPVSCCHRDD